MKGSKDYPQQLPPDYPDTPPVLISTVRTTLGNFYIVTLTKRKGGTSRLEIVEEGNPAIRRLGATFIFYHDTQKISIGRIKADVRTFIELKDFLTDCTELAGFYETAINQAIRGETLLEIAETLRPLYPLDSEEGE